MAAKLVPISAWAASRYDPPPSAWVLRKWCRAGEIFPAPERVGKEWYVAENARRITASSLPHGGLVERMQA